MATHPGSSHTRTVSRPYSAPAEKLSRVSWGWHLPGDL